MIEIKGLVDEDFVNYRKCSMFIGFPKCDWKCGADLCQNTPLAKAASREIEANVLVERYLKNPLSQAIVIGGLEPFDTYEQLIELISAFREKTFDDIVIYTGFNKDEIAEQIKELEQYPNIIIKYGRFIPNEEGRQDETLGIRLASSNQYAERLPHVITKTEDSDHAKKIKTALKKRDGHCPCSLQINDDTICPCKEFRESAENGWCHCQLYYRTKF